MILGIEGVSCVGKTTLAAALATHLNQPAVIPCYFHASPDPTRLPAPEPFTAEHQLANITQFLDVEDLRLAGARRALAEGRDVILDRTVDTLLAHAHAVGRMNGFDCDDQAQHAVTSRAVAMPDLTVVLTADPDVLACRARLRKGMPTIFYDRHFSEHFNAYFDHPLAPAVVRLDTTTGSPEELAARALDHIHRHQAGERQEAS
ncbi:AAA family ATPase [Kitasatospora sp. CM 4170]|uniref:AAA family ATPase n=1 Tax=Kitasatospora aburaviensis TaxID=67265 RepID=A0ABW1EZ95_9ACTN|nr:AAA family ATPase [Kitasatospora sp. CM 4170]WNM47348.1 AAA family ATPase [Kitasatospora sp. CM 4170]